MRLRASRSRSRDRSDAIQNRDVDDDQDDNDSNSAVVPRRRFRKRRRNPASDRSSGEEEIEVLPDRFDDQGRPLSGESRRGGGNGEWIQRRGDFEYRSPRPDGAQVRGAWGVAGTDADQIDRIVRDVSGVLASEGPPRGVGGWLGLAGRVLGGALAGGGDGAATEEEGRGSTRGGDARVGYGGSGSEVSRDGRGKGRRSIDDHGYNDAGAEEEDDEVRNDMRRRRRRRRREAD